MQTEQRKVTSGPSFWALLVGIDEYQAESVQDLNGCVNDVEAMRIFLLNQLGIPENHIRMLTNQQATRAAILHSFEAFLIDNPAVAFNNQMLFHYSGHGSQMKDTTGVEPDGHNETIVPHDSRTHHPDVYDIPDKTLGALLARLAERKGSHITVILDSCHSGSGTRRIELPGGARVRLAPADDRVPPADLDADLLVGASTRSAGPSGWAATGMSHVLLAGCRDRELSNEYWSKSGGPPGRGLISRRPSTPDFAPDLGLERVGIQSGQRLGSQEIRSHSIDTLQLHHLRCDEIRWSVRYLIIASWMICNEKHP